MDYSEIRSILETHLTANWSRTPIAYENVPFDPPEQEPWIRCILQPVHQETSSLGDLCKRTYASYWIQIFTPLNEGSGEAYNIAAELEPLFRHRQINGITFTVPTITHVGDDGNGWYMLILKAPCWV